MTARARFASVCLFLAALCSAAITPAATPVQASLQAVFAPWDDVETAVIDVLAGAHRQILVQAYLLTSKKITTTLLEAHRRGIDVRVLVDGAQLEKVPSSTAGILAAAGVPVWVETRYQNAHNKVIIVDADGPAATVLTGSFNFTWTAQHKNAENILIARNNPALAARYAENWARHRQEATPFKK